MNPKIITATFIMAGLTFSLFGKTWATPPSVKLRVEAAPQEITIGDVVSLTATISFSSGVQPLPFQPPKSLNPFELLDIRSENPVQTPEGDFRVIHQLDLTTWSTGTQTIPNLTFSFVTPSSTEPAIAQTETIDVNVKSVLEKYGDIGDLKPPKPFFGFKSYTWLWILLGVLAFFGLAYLLHRWSQSRQKNREAPAGPPKPPEEIAWDRISDIERSNLMEEGQFKEFYSRLSQILREYLENRYALPAMDRTTSEIMTEIRKSNLSSEAVSLTRQVLEMGDLVKFAKLEPKENEADDDLNRLKKFIQITTPQPAETAEKKEELPI